LGVPLDYNYQGAYSGERNWSSLLMVCC